MAKPVCPRLYANQSKLSTTDLLVRASMKNAAKCDKYCELQNSVNHRIFERTWRPLVFRRARLSERHCTRQASLGVGGRRRMATPPEPVGGGPSPRSSRTLRRARGDCPPNSHAFRRAHTQRLTSDQAGIPAELKHINKRRKRNQQGLPQ